MENFAKFRTKCHPYGGGGHGGGLLHDFSRWYLLLSIVTIQSEPRPFWTGLRPSKIRAKTPSEPCLTSYSLCGSGSLLLDFLPPAFSYCLMTSSCFLNALLMSLSFWMYSCSRWTRSCWVVWALLIFKNSFSRSFFCNKKINRFSEIANFLSFRNDFLFGNTFEFLPFSRSNLKFHCSHGTKLLSFSISLQHTPNNSWNQRVHIDDSYGISQTVKNEAQNGGLTTGLSLFWYNTFF